MKKHTLLHSVFVGSCLYGGFKKTSFITLVVYPLLEIFKTSQPELFPMARSASNFIIERFHINKWVRNFAKRQTIWTAGTFTPAWYLYFAAKCFLRNETSIAYISETKYPCNQDGKTAIFQYWLLD